MARAPLARGPRELELSARLAALALLPLLRRCLGRFLLVRARARAEMVALVLAVAAEPALFADRERVAVVADHDLLAALALTGLAGLALAREQRAAVDADAAREHRLLLVGEEPAAVDHELDPRHRLRADQRERACVRVALRAGHDLRRVVAAGVVVSDQVAAVDVRVRRAPRE